MGKNSSAKIKSNPRRRVVQLPTEACIVRRVAIAQKYDRVSDGTIRHDTLISTSIQNDLKAVGACACPMGQCDRAPPTGNCANARPGGYRWELVPTTVYI